MPFRPSTVYCASKTSRYVSGIYTRRASSAGLATGCPVGISADEQSLTCTRGPGPANSSQLPRPCADRSPHTIASKDVSHPLEHVPRPW
eukprot:scaffold1588_cov408-Prasinococcus_capsulatus_cf.AAC.10